MTGSSNGQVKNASAPFDTAVDGAIGSEFSVQLADGSGGFTGSDNLNFQDGYLTINGDSGYGQIQFLNVPNSSQYGGIGINGTANQINEGSAAGDLSIWTTQGMNFSADSGSTIRLSINGTTGAVNAYGVFFPEQAPTVSAPAYVKGGLYYDTTLNKLRVGGATAWETVSST